MIIIAKESVADVGLCIHLQKNLEKSSGYNTNYRNRNSKLTFIVILLANGSRIWGIIYGVSRDLCRLPVPIFFYKFSKLYPK